MPYDLLSLGELLVDMVAVRSGALSAPGVALFDRAAGGAPANVAAGAARLLSGRGPRGRRGRVGFIGRVGDDPFGRFLSATLASFRVDTAHLKLSPDVQTPVAIAGKAEGSQEIEFGFYGPDGGKRLVLLTPQDLPERAISEARLFALGGISLSHPNSAPVAMKAARLASEGRALLAFDPNWRPALWNSAVDWAEAVRGVLPLVDVLKVSRGELDLLCAGGSPHHASTMDTQANIAELARLAAQDRPPDKPLLVAVTMGEHGAVYALYTDPREPGEIVVRGAVAAFPVRVVDPTGAGDAFLAGLLVGLLDASTGEDDRGRLCLTNLSPTQLEHIVRFAGATGALCTTRRGAMRGLPARGAVERLMAQAQVAV